MIYILLVTVVMIVEMEFIFWHDKEMGSRRGFIYYAPVALYEQWNYSSVFCDLFTLFLFIYRISLVKGSTRPKCNGISIKSILVLSEVHIPLSNSVILMMWFSKMCCRTFSIILNRSMLYIFSFISRASSSIRFRWSWICKHTTSFYFVASKENMLVEAYYRKLKSFGRDSFFKKKNICKRP